MHILSKLTLLLLIFQLVSRFFTTFKKINISIYSKITKKNKADKLLVILVKSANLDTFFKKTVKSNTLYVDYTVNDGYVWVVFPETCHSFNVCEPYMWLICDSQLSNTDQLLMCFLTVGWHIKKKSDVSVK